MAQSDQPRRRFAPVPIETTFQSVRKTSQAAEASRPPTGPNPELTPDASPVSPPPAVTELRERRPPRHFAPQLIETSRRARRVGDAHPATKPTDKTDITPYTKHIYAGKQRAWRKRGDTEDDEEKLQRRMPPTRRETEEEAVTEYLLELAAKEAERLMQEAALDAFPNSRAREGGVAHFYFNEDSSSDKTPEPAPAARPHAQTRVRRKSSNQDLNWWQQQMQGHAQQLARERGQDLAEKDEDVVMREDSLMDEVDEVDISAPPDPIWTTTKRIAAEDRRDSIDESYAPRPLLRHESYATAGRKGSSMRADSREHDMPDALPAPGAHHADLMHRQTSRGSASSRRQGSPFSKPFGGFGLKHVEPTVHKMRQVASPPMLGKDLTFRRCPSPKLTKLEPDHRFDQRETEDKHRDVSGQGGLWRGYCFRNEEDDVFLAPTGMKNPPMIHTPKIPGTPGEPSGFGADGYFSGEPGAMFPSSESSGTAEGISLSVPDGRGRGQAKGLHMLHGLNERLQREKAASELDEKIAQEFTDEFITQVYNYLSLGYPAMALGFDEELSKIARIDVDELRRDDHKRMAKGYMMEMTLGGTPEEDRCPRWKALRIYVTEWARQHPDLGSLNPLAWGVRERRGSWAI